MREKELGSIANFYAAPATKAEFLLGKQLPYIGVALIQFVDARSRSQSSCSRSRSRAASLTLAWAGCIYVLASTGFGLLISVFAATQTAAIFAAAIITILPAVAVLRHVRADLIADRRRRRSPRKIFPSTYFQAISVGTFTKALGLDTRCGRTSPRSRSSPPSISALSVLLLKKQEA